MAKIDLLRTYREKRNFAVTPEPRGGKEKPHKIPIFVVQEHHASKLHWDFRLEVRGVLKSWAVPKGPSMDPKDKRLAVPTEDHPLEYAGFEGTIPEGEYGAGYMTIWDRGTYEPFERTSMEEAIAAGHVKVRLEGERLKGAFALTRVRDTGETAWILVKMRDEHAASRRKSAPAKKSRAGRVAKAPDRTSMPVEPPKGGPAVPEHEALRKLSTKARRLLVKAPQPEWIEPMLATLTSRVFSNPDWVFEPKLDGARCVVYCRGKDVRLMSRNRKLQNSSYPELVDALRAQPANDFVVDGEIVAFQGELTSFARLQHRMHVKDPNEARAKGVDVYLYLFDVLHLAGYDTTGLPLLERKELLRRVMKWEDPLRYSEHRRKEGVKFYREACRKRWEGLIAKRSDSAYVSGRGYEWVKLKCIGADEFVVGGYTEPKGTRVHLGALLVGYYEGRAFRYAGKVGTGFDRPQLKGLLERLRPLEQRESPFADAHVAGDGAHWVKPELVAQIGYSEMTSDGRLRHPRYLGLREDKAARNVTRPGFEQIVGNE